MKITILKRSYLCKYHSEKKLPMQIPFWKEATYANTILKRSYLYKCNREKKLAKEKNLQLGKEATYANTILKRSYLRKYNSEKKLPQHKICNSEKKLPYFNPAFYHNANLVLTNDVSNTIGISFGKILSGFSIATGLVSPLQQDWFLHCNTIGFSIATRLVSPLQHDWFFPSMPVSLHHSSRQYWNMDSLSIASICFI